MKRNDENSIIISVGQKVQGPVEKANAFSMKEKSRQVAKVGMSMMRKVSEQASTQKGQ